MRRGAVILCSVIIGFLGVSFGFSDIDGSVYKEDILQLKERGVVQGYEDGTFKPDQPVSRVEMLKIILKTANIDILSAQEPCFQDVYRGDWYYDLVCSAKQLKIIGGYEDGTFRPNQHVLLTEGLKIGVEGFGLETAEEGKVWYEKYQNFVDKAGIFSKYAYYPDQVLTRGMMAHLAYGLLLGLEGKWSEISGFKSLGCGKSQPSTTPESIEVGGELRHFITKVGKNYRQNRPAKLIFGFHGRTSDNRSVAGYYNLDEVGDDNAIYVYPLGLPEEGPTRSWRSGGDKVSNLRDYALFDVIRQNIEQQYCIDQNQIYVVGHSLGGWFTSMLNCARGQQIRGVGIVAGSPMQFPSCNGPSAAIIFHNPADNLASFAGGEQLRDYILKQNQCGGETRSYANSYAMDCVEYTQCLPGAPVVFCSYREGRHTWPRGAEQMMYDFWNKL